MANGATGTDPDLALHRAGVRTVSESVVDGQETLLIALAAGDYVIEIYEFSNLGGSPLGDTCFDVTITQL